MPVNIDCDFGRREFLSSLAAVSGAAFVGERFGFSAEPAKDSKKSKEPVPLNKQGTVLIDVDGKRLLLKTKVCLREGVLEMFCCLKQTKEHESILSIDSEAFVIHTGLLALGAKPGSPVKFQPEYSPAKGTRIRIFCQWTDKEGKPHREPAEKWVRNSSKRFFVELFDEKPAGLDLKEDSELKWDEKHKELFWFGHMTEKQRDTFLAMSKDAKYRKAIQKFFDRTQPRQLDAPWVFAGSGFFVDEANKTKSYLAEGGDLICVANFASAMLDLAVQSSATGESNLMWEAWTDQIPPVGTEVLLELVPELDAKPLEKTEKPK
ncbi:MAG: hypothetical protein FD138_660 [Planctomycetota bacterium]|nr:MAG: hypothetical protein FD138_660 [Planctomycetota bacterium]